MSVQETGEFWFVIIYPWLNAHTLYTTQHSYYKLDVRLHFRLYCTNSFCIL
jgi:hypothetical protein